MLYLNSPFVLCAARAFESLSLLSFSFLLSGFVSMATTAERPDLVKGCIVINGAGRFEEEISGGKDGRTTEAGDEESRGFFQKLFDPIIKGVKRLTISFAFYNTKRPERIEEVLKQVRAIWERKGLASVMHMRKCWYYSCAATVFFLFPSRSFFLPYCILSAVYTGLPRPQERGLGPGRVDPPPGTGPQRARGEGTMILSALTCVFVTVY
jgi:pimeloyl-ACP methyl ester carboxylesterase